MAEKQETNALKVVPIHIRYFRALNDIKNPELDGVNPHFKSRFSTLKQVLSTINKACAKHGVHYHQHIKGSKIESGLVAEDGSVLGLSETYILESDNPQKVGSCITYMRRYIALTDFCIVGDPDDDGNEAAGKPAPQQPDQVDKRESYLNRVEELQTQAISLGIKPDGIASYVQAKYKKPWSDLECDELQEIGVYIKQLIADKEQTNG